MADVEGKELVLLALNVLAKKEEANRIQLMNSPRFMNNAIKALRREDGLTVTAQERTLQLLQNLASVQPNLFSIAPPHGLMASILHPLEHGTLEIKVQTMHLLKTLALTESNSLFSMDLIITVTETMEYVARQMEHVQALPMEKVVDAPTKNVGNGESAGEPPVQYARELEQVEGGGAKEDISKQIAIINTCGYRIVYSFSTNPINASKLRHLPQRKGHWVQLLKILKKELKTFKPDRFAILAMANIAPKRMMQGLGIDRVVIKHVMKLFDDSVNSVDLNISQVLPSILALSAEASNRAAFRKIEANLILFCLVQAIQNACLVNDWESTRIAIQSLGFFGFDEESLEWMKSELELIEILEKIKTMTTEGEGGEDVIKMKNAAQILTSKMTKQDDYELEREVAVVLEGRVSPVPSLRQDIVSGEQKAHSLWYQYQSPRFRFPNNKTQLKSWLEVNNLSEIEGVLMKEEFTDAASLQSLGKRPTVEIQGLLKISGAKACLLSDLLVKTLADGGLT